MFQSTRKRPVFSLLNVLGLSSRIGTASHKNAISLATDSSMPQDRLGDFHLPVRGLMQESPTIEVAAIEHKTSCPGVGLVQDQSLTLASFQTVKKLPHNSHDQDWRNR